VLAQDTVKEPEAKVLSLQNRYMARAFMTNDQYLIYVFVYTLMYIYNGISEYMGTCMAIVGRTSTKKTTLDKRRAAKASISTKKIMPRLDTVEMIEATIRKKQYFESKTKLWKALPRGVQYGTLGIALAYLERSNKITQNRDGSLVWIFVESNIARKSLEQSTEL
jgi:hypothetical protein